MSNYNFPPSRKANDYMKGKLTQDEIIAIQISNDAITSAARKDIKMGIVQPLTVRQTLSPAELLADDSLQEANAQSNLERLGFRPQEASDIITAIRTDNNLSFGAFNSNFPAIEADIKARFNIKLITPAFFVEYLRQYTQELLASRGLSVGNASRNINALINSVAEIRQILPTQEQMRELTFRLINVSRNVTDRNLLNPILERIDMVGRALPSQIDYGRIQNLNMAETQRIIQRINTLTSDLPTKDQVDNLIQQVDRGDRDIMTSLTALADSIPDDFKRKMDSVMKEVRDVASSQEDIIEEMTKISKMKGKKDWDGTTIILDEVSWSGLNLIGKKRFLRSRLEEGDNVRGVTIGEINTLTVPDADRIWNAWVENNSSKYSAKESSSSSTRPSLTSLKSIFRKGEEKSGNGLMRSSIKVGRGIAVKQTPSYKEYGKYAIHIPQLEQQDLLNVKYKSLGQIPKFKPIAVSDVFRDFILDLLENGKPNGRVYTQIPTDERKYFEEMSIGAGVWNSLGLKRTTTSTDEEESKRFELLRGEYLAGNNNQKVISELRKLVVKMMNDGRIRKNQGIELLMELSL
jgi:hypothetical protein